MRPCTRELSRSLERQISVWYQHKEYKFPTQSTLDGGFFSCCDNGSPDGRDVQAGLTDGWSIRDIGADSLYI
jgi:hypothetical protein